MADSHFSIKSTILDKITYTFKGMGSFEFPVEIFPIWKALLWCFYPIFYLIPIELLIDIFNDDYHNYRGEMLPDFQDLKA